MDPVIDFPLLMKKAGIRGVLDPNSITVIDTLGGNEVPHALSEDFAWGDTGRVEWVIDDPSHVEYEIRFRVADLRPPLLPPARTPMIGTGDLLRYNAGVPRPITLPFLSRLVDLNGDGVPDLVGCWNYAYRPDVPWDGVVCYPGVGKPGDLEFGDLVHIRHVPERDSTDYRIFSRIYMTADLADFDGDGRLDLVCCPANEEYLHFFLDSGRRDAGGMPVFVEAGRVPRGTKDWQPCRAVDLDGDGAVEIVVGATWIRNTQPGRWPFEPAAPVTIDAGTEACFLDVDGDGKLDAVCLVDGPEGEPRARRVAWRRNLRDGTPGSAVPAPRFAAPQLIEGIDCSWPSSLCAVDDGKRRGVLVLHDLGQRISFYQLEETAAVAPRFRRAGDARSLSAVLALSDQAWPFACDWDADGDWDLVVGGGYGWPRIVVNEGTSAQPAFAEPKPILSNGRPIRLLRDEILGGTHWHNMGYPYPAFVDWNGDGLGDLILPNETNRIFWYENTGTRQEPSFGDRIQIICDGYPDSPAKRTESARLASDPEYPNSPYPLQADEPFFWRTGVGFGDLNGDGKLEMITHDGATRKLTMFVPYRDSGGQMRLRKDRLLKLKDGRLIDDTIVERKAHWTEAFRCTDWDGDGLVDIVYCCAGTEREKGSIYLLRNCGTPADPVFEPPVTLCCFGVPIKVTAHGPSPAVADLDGDGRPDILACVEWSVYPYFSHTAIEMKERPACTLGEVTRCPPG